MSLAARLAAVRARVDAACARAARDPRSVQLVAVSKTHPVDAVRAALAAGQLEFGENRIQELTAKAAALGDARARWHMIGSIQTNKVDDLLAVPGLTLVHSLDRSKLADALQKRWAQAPVGAPLPCLLEVNASGEASKHGVTPSDAPVLLAHVRAACPALEVRGLMAMGPLVGDAAPVFAAVARLRAELQQRGGLPLPVLSMGMSGDLEAAIAAGATLVRVGTAIFGERSAD